MILTDNRQALDTALSQKLSICVLLGSPPSPASKAHDCMESGGWDDVPWHCWFLITEKDLLASAERLQWFGGIAQNDYAFLGRKTRQVSSTGTAQTELLDDGACDYLTYVQKFAEADLM